MMVVIPMSSKPTTNDTAEAEFDDDLQPGTKLLHGQYVIEEFLNNGGFGITYLARDSLNRLVVIKECYPESICRRTNSTVRVRSRNQADAFRAIVDLFIEEARNLARLSHPNIVGVHQVFEDNDTAYIAMDFVEGRDLLDIAESSSSFKPEALERIVVKLLDAIEFIHHEGILHRDIAPDNILLSKDYDPVLIDFGAARETVTRATRYLGSMRTVKDGYSPQEFYVTEADQYPSSDLYSLAASLYHVMTKELPNSAQERLSAIAAGEGDPYVSIKGRVEGYTEPFLDAIDRALSVFPKERIQSAAEWRGLITQTKVSQDTRGTVSRPMLAVDNGNIVQDFQEAGLVQAKADVDAPEKMYPSRKVRPVSAKEAENESVFLDDGREVVAEKDEKPQRKGLYVGVAAIGLFAILGAGVYFAKGTDGDVSAPVAQDNAGVETVAGSGPVTGQEAVATPVSPEQAAAVETPSETGSTTVADSADASTANDAPTFQFTGDIQVEGPVVGRIRPNTLSVAEPTAREQASNRIATEPSPPAQPVIAEEPVETAGPSAQSDLPEATLLMTGMGIQFSVTPDATDPTVVSAVAGAAADYLEPGQRVLSVNGFPIETLDDFQRVVEATAGALDTETLEVTLGIEDPSRGETFIRSAELPTVRQTMLLNGAQFETLRDGDDWATIVTRGTGQGESDLQAGDRLVALMPANELINQESSFSDLMNRELQNGTTQFNFAVNRDGDMWLVSMRYAASAGN